MIERARAIARETDDPYLRGAAAVSEGQVGVLTGQWQTALERSDEGIAILQERCRAVIWECDLAHSALLRALEELGRMRECAQRARRLATQADELGDRYGATVAALYLGVARVAEGDVAGARATVEGALRHWSRQEWFLLQQLYALRVEAYGDLFEGRPEVAWERIRSAWPAIRRSSLLRVPATRIDCLLLRSRISLESAAGGAASRAGYLRRCERDARRLGSEGRTDTNAHAALLRAGVAATRGESSRALPLIDEAIRGYGEAGMALYRACALRRKGEILGGDEGTQLVATADGLMNAEGIGEPSRWATVCAPGFEAASRSPS
jgi:tetratricopeptide (TPR) repeat protein